jgi:hypothetical protein
MTRLYFESPVHVVSPQDSTTDEHRRQMIPARPVIVVGLLAIACTLGGVGLQRFLFATPPPRPIEASQEEAARHGRLVAIFLTDDASEAARRMERESFADDAVDRVLSRRFVCRWLDASNSGDLEIAQRYEMATAPTLVLTSPDGSILHGPDGEPMRHVGYLGPDELHSFLADAIPPSKRSRQKPVVSLREER